MAGFDEGRLGAVIDRFYEAAARPELWRAVLAEAADALGAEGAIIVPGPKSSFAPISSEGLDEMVAVGLRDGRFVDNARVDRGALTSHEEVVTESMVFSLAELDFHPFNAEYIDRIGFRWYAGLDLVRDEPRVFLSFERRKNQSMFSHREIDLLRDMVPHLQRAGQLGLSLAEGRERATLDAFELMGFGGLLLDRTGRLLRANARAQGHFGRGLALRQGRLHAGPGGADAALQRLVAGALRPGLAHEAPAEGAVALFRAEGRPLVVHATPIVGSAVEMSGRAKALLLVIDPDERREPADAVLRQLFGLTPAEARVARALARGCGVQAIAREQGISDATARAHLKAIFAKTETRRQAELVALLGRLATAPSPGP